jgi:hypothetical protein
MKNYLIAVTAVVALLAPVQTRADIVNIDFSFENKNISPPTYDFDIVFTGEIVGLTVGGTSSASAVYITGYSGFNLLYPTAYPYTFPTPLLITNSDPSYDTFTVDAAGNLTAASFRGESAAYDASGDYVYLSLTYDGPGSGTDVAGLFQYIVPPSGPLDQTGGDFGNGDYTTVSSTPLPAALPLFASGLGAMGLLGWRRKRKNTAAIAAA